MGTIDPNYEVRTLLEPFYQGPLVHTFLRDTFFTGRQYPPSGLVELDFRRGRRKMAPFVAPLVTGKVMERVGFETRFYRAPRIAPVRTLRTPDLEARLPGETIFSGRTAADRAAELLAEDSIFLDEAISRREEWMCREVMLHGNIVVTADHGYTQVIDYLQSYAGTEDNTFPIAMTWDQDGSDPLADLEAARLWMIQRSGISPNVVLMGTAAYNAFTRNQAVYHLLENRRFELGQVEPIIENQAVVRFARVPGLELYSYSEWFEDDDGQLFEMLPATACILASTETPNTIVYGAYTQLEDARNKQWRTYQTDRIPFVYGSEENGHLYYRLTACPLPMPADALGFGLIQALPEAAGASASRIGKQPKFKPNPESPGEAGGGRHTVRHPGR